MSDDAMPMQQYSRADLLSLVQQLPEETALSAQFHSSQKQAWIHWLSNYVRSGDIGRADRRRDARFIFNKLNLAPMIIWLAESSGVDAHRVRKANDAVVKSDSAQTQTAKVRQILPWELIASHLERFSHDKSLHKTSRIDSQGSTYLETNNDSTLRISEEMPADEEFEEGTVNQVLVKRYERDPAVRKLCIEHYGTSCIACGVSLADRYGPEVSGLIHVHHLTRLADIGRRSLVDPVRDLGQVCPNCHAVVHATNPPRTIEQVQKMVREQKRTSK